MPKEPDSDPKLKALREQGCLHPRPRAEDRGNRAIGVILSGTASDGTMGLKAIKTECGITFAQDMFFDAAEDKEFAPEPVRYRDLLPVPANPAITEVAK